MHLKLAKEIPYDEWLKYLTHTMTKVHETVYKKKKSLNKKLTVLLERAKIENTDTTTPPIKEQKFVTNLSSKTFSKEEMDLLEQGLNFTPKPSKIPLLDIVADIETAIKYQSESVKQDIRKVAKPLVRAAKTSNRGPLKQQSSNNVLKTLKEKDCVYTKSDKGRDIVIMDQGEYMNRMRDTLESNGFREMGKSPLPGMISDSKKILKLIEEEFGRNIKVKLMVPNPRVPKLYGNPKTHKPGNKMRPVISNIDAPTSTIAQWLVEEFKQYEPPENSQVTNSYDFSAKIKDLTVGDNENMVSFDVEMLFPSVPIPETVEIVSEWLKNVEPDSKKRNVYIKAIKLCMKYNCCQFDGKFYKSDRGTSMGDPLSPPLANIFLSHLETRLKRNNMLPRVWWRFMDDVYAIINKHDDQKWLQILNDQYSSINFTIEVEKNGSLPFLDLNITRLPNGKLDLAIYRKPTNVPRYIPAKSHCPVQHKKAAFNSMIFRMCQLPLSKENFNKERDYLYHTAIVNGYQKSMVDNMVTKHSKTARKNQLTSMFNTKKDREVRRVKFHFAPEITNKLKSILKKHEMQMVFGSVGKLKDIIGSTKDKTEDIKKAGIYEITCEDCSLRYYGQTKRNIDTRYKEHSAAIKFNRPEISSVAAHVLNCGHYNLTKNNLRLVKNVTNPHQLDAYESIFMHLNGDELMNTMDAPIRSPLIAML